MPAVSDGGSGPLWWSGLSAGPTRPPLTQDESVDVAIVAGSVQISENGRIIRVHQIRHDRTKEHGAFATPKGRPRIKKTA